MQYRYPPLYKYIVLFIMIYMFHRHDKVVQPIKALLNSLMFVFMIIAVDYIMIQNHCNIIETNEGFDDIDMDEIRKLEQELDQDEDLDDEDDIFDDEDEQPQNDRRCSRRNNTHQVTIPYPQIGNQPYHDQYQNQYFTTDGFQPI